MDNSNFPELNTRARGWRRYVWNKATTVDDWSSIGTPLPWWDKTTTAPMCSFPRFDLSETSYSLPLMADQTPAWREVYTRIADELVGRYTTYWAAVDWLTLIGHDPNRDNYPPDWLVWMPEKLQLIEILAQALQIGQHKMVEELLMSYIWLSMIQLVISQVLM